MPPAAGVTAMDAAMPPPPLTDNGDDYNNEGGGQRDKRGERMS